MYSRRRQRTLPATLGVTISDTNAGESDLRGSPTGDGPLTGVRVIELGLWVAGPAVGAVLADWGADVIKVEPPGGDPQRLLEGVAGAGGEGLPLNPSFDVTNRGKRSIVLDLKQEGGADVLHRLIAGADVLVSNMRVAALRRLGLDYDSLAERYPRLVYGLLTGYGTEGPDHDTPGYDIGAFWSRAGIAASLMVPGTTLPFQRGAMGDRTAAAALAGGISAALYARHRTGRGQLVSESLLRWGTYMMSSDVSMALAWGLPMATAQRETMASPTVNCYRCQDDRWFWLTGLERARHWPPLVAAVQRPEWLTDSRFATAPDRQANAGELIALLDEIFRQAPRDEWLSAFDKHGVWSQPVNTIPELLEDPQLVPSGGLAAIVEPEGHTTVMVNTPIDFSDTSAGPRKGPPDLGEHVGELLSELGFDEPAQERLQADGSLG